MLRLFLLATASLCFAVAQADTPSPVSPASLLRNGAFADADGDGIADGWPPGPTPNGKTTFLSLADGVVKIKDTDEVAGVGLGQKVAAQPSHRYTLRAQVRGGALPLYLRFFDAANHL